MEEIQSYQNKNNSSGVAGFCNGQLLPKLRNSNEIGAGSGISVPSAASRREAPLDISNPRVLSDMGLTILITKTLKST